MKRSLFLLGCLFLTALPSFSRIFVPATAPNTRSAADSNATTFVAPYGNLPKLDATLTLLVKAQVAQSTRAISLATDTVTQQLTTPNGTFPLNGNVAFNLVTLDDKAPLVLRTIERLGGTARTITDTFFWWKCRLTRFRPLLNFPKW